MNFKYTWNQGYNWLHIWGVMIVFLFKCCGNLSTFSLLLEKPNYKNPRSFLYCFDHIKFLLIAYWPKTIQKTKAQVLSGAFSARWSSLCSQFQHLQSFMNLSYGYISMFWVSFVLIISSAETCIAIEVKLLHGDSKSNYFNKMAHFIKRNEK